MSYIPYASLSDMQAWASGIMMRDPDLIIGDNYMRRWWVIPRNTSCNVYLHDILHSDDDPAMHDHPWANTSFLITGSYTCGTPFWRKKKDILKGNNKFCSRACYSASLKGVSRPVPTKCMERGIDAAAIARRSRTHCKRGHPLSGDNLFQTSSGGRGCKECRKIHKATYRGKLSNG